MAMEGRIVSFDPVMHAGLIQPASSTHAVLFLDGDLQNVQQMRPALVGRDVTFDLLQTEQGFVAVNVHVKRPRLRLPEQGFALWALPILIAIGVTALATTGLVMYLQWSVLLSYIVAVNLVCFMIVMSMGPAIHGRKPQAFLSLSLLAFAGGAFSTLLATFLVPGRWHYDATRVILLGLTILQCLAVHVAAPDLFTRATWEEIARPFARPS